MELDFKTVQALSSPTRIKILNEALKKEATPTDISDRIGRSKSTVSSHLEKLQEAELLEKDSEEGRRRVIYRPTKKTEAIIKGRSRKVKFSVLSTVSNAWIAGGLMLGALASKAESASRDSAGQMGTMEAMDAGTEAAKTASQTAGPESVLLFAGFGFLSIALAGLFYGLVVSRLRSDY
jgi:DNA-binding transcriptional ArsR family regulator